MTRTIRNLILTLTALAVFTPAARADLIVVVNDSNSVTNLSMTELKRIYLGKTTVYEGGLEITLAEYTPVSEDFYQTVLDMSTRRTRRHWMKLVFSASHATPPKVFKKIEKAIRFIQETEGAICFVEPSDLTRGMKVLSIEGKKPGEEGYPLQQKRKAEPPNVGKESN